MRRRTEKDAERHRNCEASIGGGWRIGRLQFQYRNGLTESVPARHFALAKGYRFYTFKAEGRVPNRAAGIVRASRQRLSFFHVSRNARLWIRQAEFSAMQLSPRDRRMMRRFDMRLPAVVRVDDTSEFHTETQNVSARGVFFYLDRAVLAGTLLEVTLTFPPHVTLTDSVRVRFRARVIRVDHHLPSSRIGTAAMIENYEFLRSEGTVDFLSAPPKESKAAN
jgi:hypothetical protein